MTCFHAEGDLAPLFIHHFWDIEPQQLTALRTTGLGVGFVSSRSSLIETFSRQGCVSPAASFNLTAQEL